MKRLSGFPAEMTRKERVRYEAVSLAFAILFLAAITAVTMVALGAFCHAVHGGYCPPG